MDTHGRIWQCPLRLEQKDFRFDLISIYTFSCAFKPLNASYYMIFLMFN